MSYLMLTREEATAYLKANKLPCQVYGTCSDGSVWVRSSDRTIEDTVYVAPDADGTFDKDDLDYAITVA